MCTATCGLPLEAPQPSMEAAAAAAVRAVDGGANSGAFAAAAAPEAHAPGLGAEEGEAGGSGLVRERSGLLQYRAPIDPQQRGKLESFDRKIGRAANALRVGCLVWHSVLPCDA